VFVTNLRGQKKQVFYGMVLRIIIHVYKNIYEIYKMKLFHILTIIISISVFFGLFIYTFIMFNTKNKTFPPDITDCPDYWKVNDDGTCQIPKPGELNLGNLDAVKDSNGNIVSSTRGRQIYMYKSSKNGTTYSYLPSYYDPISVNLLNGKPAKNLPLGYYESDIPYGYDSSAPQRGVIDFNDIGWASFGDPYCEIKRWATAHNIQWDGIANYNKC
jgi:hypothetical protein